MNRKRLAIALFAASMLQFACASPATPPESSPVYGDALNPSVKPIDVETTSLNDPQSRKIGSAAEAPAETFPEQDAADSATANSTDAASPEDSPTPATPAAPAIPEPAAAKQSAPKAPSAPDAK